MTTPMKVVKTTIKDVPELSTRIKNAIESDPTKRSVQVIATLAGLSGAYVYNLMNDKPAQVNLDVIRKLEEILGVDLEVQFND
jgi:transcriptional regulator with XRE-family HTH domain